MCNIADDDVSHLSEALPYDELAERRRVRRIGHGVQVNQITAERSLVGGST